jgi:hypothetical protein
MQGTCAIASRQKQTWNPEPVRKTERIHDLTQPGGAPLHSSGENWILMLISKGCTYQLGRMAPSGRRPERRWEARRGKGGKFVTLGGVHVPLSSHCSPAHHRG